jgi:NRPS condensation-like uncharacterized protein
MTAVLAAPAKIPSTVCQRRLTAGLPDYGCDINCLLTLDRQLDVSRLQAAVAETLAIDPILGYKWTPHRRYPYWSPMSVEEQASMTQLQDVSAADLDTTLTAFLNQQPNMPVQATVFRGLTDTLALKLDHRLLDGTAVRQYAYRLADVYTRLGTPGVSFPRLGFHERTHRMVSQTLPRNERWQMLKELLKEVKRLRKAPGWSLPTVDASTASPPLWLTLSPDEQSRLQQFAMQHRATPPQVILAALSQSLAALCALNDGLPRPLNLAVDLRRYLKSDEDQGASVCAGGAVVWLPPLAEQPLSDVVRQVREQLWAQRGSRFGMVFSEVPADLPVIRTLMNCQPYRGVLRMARHQRKELSERGFILVTDLGHANNPAPQFGDAVVTDFRSCGGRMAVSGMIMLAMCQGPQGLSMAIGYGPKDFVQRLRTDLQQRLVAVIGG